MKQMSHTSVCEGFLPFLNRQRRPGRSKYAPLCALVFAFSVAATTNAFAQNALNCEPSNNVLDQVVRANIGRLQTNETDSVAIAAIDSVLRELVAREPRRQSIDGPFARGSDAAKLGMICLGMGLYKYQCTYVYSTRLSAGLGRGWGHVDVWMLQFEVTIDRERTSMRVNKIQPLGAATAPTRC
jgi:hypothetical protein